MSNKVYLIECDGYYKIGVSEDPENRLDRFQTGNPYELSLEAKIDVEQAYDIEEKLHSYYNSKHKRGEWFNLNQSDVKNIKQKNLNIFDKSDSNLFSYLFWLLVVISVIVYIGVKFYA
jgi:predicted GIY-YIG superfamily endonuclease